MRACKVTFSLVVYEQPLEELRKALDSLLLYKADKIIYIIDNSHTDSAHVFEQTDQCVEYYHMPNNIGFGKGHNFAIRKAEKAGSEYHFVVNPDIYFNTDIVTPMIDYMDRNTDVGQMMPKILYPDGKMQYLPKLMPSPRMLLQRKASKIIPQQHARWMQYFEMRSMRDDRVYEVGHVSGCFSVMRMDAFRKCGIYDERFFLYFEDTDLTRRIHREYKTLYFPMVSVFHIYGHGASQNPLLFFVFLGSLIKYFNKWGWFCDKERKDCNRFFLRQLQSHN